MRLSFGLLKSGNLFARTIAQVVIVAVAGTVSVSAVSTSAFATLTSIAYNATPQAISSGTLLDTVTAQASTGGVGFAATFSNMNPGDTRTVVVAYANNGTDSATSLTLSAAVAASNTLSSDAARGLQVSVATCAVPWVYTAGLATPPTCNGVAGTTVLTLPMATLVSNTTGQAFSGSPTIAAGATLYLRFSVGLPTQSEVWANGVLATNGAVGTTGITVAGNPASSITGLTAAVTWVIHATASQVGGSNNV